MNKELLAIFDYLEREKGIERDLVITILEEALLSIVKKSLGENENVSVIIQSKTGEIELFVEKEITDSVEEEEGKISIDLARELDPECNVGQFLDVPIPVESLGRIAAQKMRHIVSQKIREIERELVYKKYRHLIGKIISGTVKRMIRGNHIIVDLGKVEGIMLARHYPKAEHFREGEKVQAVLLDMQELQNGRMEILLSRSDALFVESLLRQEVPEINEQIVHIEKIVREAGVRTKVAVSTKEDGLDPVGACIGVRGNRIKNVIQELNNEKIDIVCYHPLAEKFLANLLHPVIPISMSKEENDEEKEYFLVIVRDEDYPAAVGKRKANIRLNGQLLEMECAIWKKSEYNQHIEQQIELLQTLSSSWLDSRISIDHVKQADMYSLIIEATLQDLIDAGFVTWRMLLRTEKNQLAEQAGCDRENIQTVLEALIKKQKKLEKVFEK